MPVSHLGLTVSHIPSATSFYLSALQPLGYRYVGQQGDSIGLGVESADFFLTQAPYGSRASPTHIAFSAASRLIVRECYTAALNAGGQPNGAPNYRNDDCTCFNAAVEDLDGNTIEFIYRQPHAPTDHDAAAPSEHGHTRLREGGPRGDLEDDDDARTANSRSSKASKSTKNTEVVSQESPSQKSSVSGTLIGAALGAAAGAAIVYAMVKEERKNARDEIEHMASKQPPAPAPQQAITERRPPSPTAETVPVSKSEKTGRKSHRNFSTTESTYVSRRPSVYQAMRAIEPAPSEQDPILESISRYNAQQRPDLMRRQTYDGIEYMSVPRSSANTQYSMRRAATLPVDVDVPNYYIEAPESTASSRHSATSRHSHRSHRSHRSRRNSLGSESSRLRRHDSGISVHSSRSHHERGSDSGRRSSASTIKPSRRESIVTDQVSTHSKSMPYDQVSRHSASIPHEEASIHSSGFPQDRASTHSKSIPYDRVSTHSKSIPYDRVSTHSRSIAQDQVPTHSRSIAQDQVSTHSRSVAQDRGSTHSNAIPYDRISSHSRSIPPDHTSILSKSAPASRHAESYYQSAAGVPLPPSITGSSAHHGSSHSHRHRHRDEPSSQYESAVEVPIPSSKATSYVSAHQIPLPASEADLAWEDMLAGEESDGLGDTRTVVPEDSISCVGMPAAAAPAASSSSRRHGKSRSSHHSSSRRSDASERTVRPAKKSGGSSRHSAMTLPVRSKREEREDGKRSAVSYS